MTTTPAASAWTVAVDPDEGVWEISTDGTVVETVRSHYDAYEVLEMAEREAGMPLSWRLDGTGGFVST
jgi:hypothetical protein